MWNTLAPKASVTSWNTSRKPSCVTAASYRSPMSWSLSTIPSPRGWLSGHFARRARRGGRHRA
eukprot:16302-Eustigmatos_ZCMA.PRE.1